MTPLREILEEADQTTILNPPPDPSPFADTIWFIVALAAFLIAWILLPN